jgi:hypothetical protein
MGEVVSVQLKTGVEDLLGSQIGDCDLDFSVSNKELNNKQSIIKLFQNEIRDQNISNNRSYRAAKSLKKINKANFNLPADFPQLDISVFNNPSAGYIFMSSFSASDFAPGSQNQDGHYIIILDNRGRPFYYRKMSNFCFDFKLQPSGLITYFDRKYNYFFAMNNQFEITNSYYCENGYSTDGHELRILPNGHYLIIGGDFEKVDMSKIVAGGDTSAIVMGIVIQEIDKNRNVVFQWRSFDHFKITDATDDINLTAANIDYVHTNAIEVDTDGNILISSRHLDEITKINRQTGDIIWRLGGKNNQFQFINDSVGFSHQHDVRRLPNGDISLFDDGNLHWSQLPSRALEYKLDEKNLSAQLVWQFKNSPDEFSTAMGSVQRLDDGNTLIGWGTGSPAITEVTSQGMKVFELFLPDGMMNYRAFRFKLNSSYYQSLVPSLASPPDNSHVADTAITLSWNKNKFAQSFQLQLAKDSTFANIVYQDSGLVNTSIKIASLVGGVKYYWRVLSDNNTDSVGGYAGYSETFSFTTSKNIPQTYSLKHNFPNPFNPSTNIVYDIPSDGLVVLKVYDILGKEVKTLVNKYQKAGEYQVSFDASNLASGIYLYRLTSGSFSQTRKMILEK